MLCYPSVILLGSPLYQCAGREKTLNRRIENTLLRRVFRTDIKKLIQQQNGIGLAAVVSYSILEASGLQTFFLIARPISKN